MLPEERHRTAHFIALFYAELFLRSRMSVFAPNDDFHFLASMLWYQEKDDQIATAVIASIKSHLWYLTKELVDLALFNERLSDFTRMLMAKNCLILACLLRLNLASRFFPLLILTHLHRFTSSSDQDPGFYSGLKGAVLFAWMMGLWEGSSGAQLEPLSSSSRSKLSRAKVEPTKMFYLHPRQSNISVIWWRPMT